LNLFACAKNDLLIAENDRLRSLLLAVVFVWQPGQMFEGGATVLIDGVLYRARNANWNIYPCSVAGAEYWEKVGELK
jgi:hypothetical protein